MPSTKELTRDSNCNDCGQSFSAEIFGDKCSYCGSTNTDVFRRDANGEPLSIIEARQAIRPS